MDFKFYKAFMVPNFRNCSAVWHFCGARNKDKLGKRNRRSFKIVANENALHYKRVLMRLTDRRKTAKNLADSRKNWKILTVSRKQGKKEFTVKESIP